jgi:hypothetical protein
MIWAALRNTLNVLSGRYARRYPYFTNLSTLGKEECGGSAWVMLLGSGMQAVGPSDDFVDGIEYLDRFFYRRGLRVQSLLR